MAEFLSPSSLAVRVDAIVAGQLLAKTEDFIESSLHILRPPQRMSTVECAEKYRLFPASEGGGLYRYSTDRTPYNVGPMDALDDPTCNLMVMVKPSRSGGTTVAENYIFKLMKFGPMGNIGWYLASDDAVKKYTDLVVKPMFENHVDLELRLGTGRSDRNDTSKRVSGYLVEWLSASDNNFRNREPLVIVMDETDGWNAKFAETPVVEAKARQKQLGNRKKAIVMSHPDKGWDSGSAAAWVDTSRGIYVMRCVECDGYAAAHATRHWDVQEFKLDYSRDTDASVDTRLDMASSSAGMLCPCCGVLLDDEQRKVMIDEGQWMHRGQTLDQVIGIVGDMTPTPDRGFWVHGLMLKVVSVAELAREMESALIKLDRTGKPTQLRAFLSKQLGEIFDGKGRLATLNAMTLHKRAGIERVAEVGECPPQVMFITAAVDVGASKFDVSFYGWDLEARSWWLDRHTIRQRVWDDGIARDIRTRERIEDWDMLIEQVLNRKFRIIGNEDFAMPVALMTVDVGDGNVVWKGREFARRALNAGHYWGSSQAPWAKVRLIQGSPRATAPELPVTPTKIDKDEHGAVMKPIISEYTLGVHKLKELVVDRLGVTDGGPGQCMFAHGIGSNYFDEFFNERLIDGKWVRNGPNESLDLFAYAEAARLMIRPDRADYDWSGKRLPPWAKPVRIVAEVKDETAKPSPVVKKQSIFARFDALNNAQRDN